MHALAPLLLSLFLATLVAPPSYAADTNAAAASSPAPDPAKKQLAMLKAQPLAADTIFSKDTFPKIDFLNHDLVEAAVGPYTLHVRFFDAAWNEVTVPKAPGRYGALIDVSTPSGVNFTQNLVLYKTPGNYRWAKETYDAEVKFPSAFGISPELTASEQWNINNTLGGVFGVSEGTDDHVARLLAALQTIAADPARWRGFNVSSINAAWWSELQKRLGETQDYQYLINRPDGYEATSKTWPLIVFLHGSGERGHDLSKLENQGPRGYINKGHPLPFIVVMPQCPDDERWDPARVGRLVDKIVATEHVDPKRIYLTGLSLGGYATLETAATYPSRFAAIASLSGGENPGLAQRLRKTPTWLFHGDEDNTVPPRYSIDLAHALQKLGAQVKLTIYPGVGHEKWNVTYSDPALYAWFLAHSK